MMNLSQMSVQIGMSPIYGGYEYERVFLIGGGL